MRGDKSVSPNPRSLWEKREKKLASIIKSERETDGQCHSRFLSSRCYFIWLCLGYEVVKQFHPEMFLPGRYLVMLHRKCSGAL